MWECTECGRQGGPADDLESVGEDALVLLREASCEAGVHWSRTLGACVHTRWVRGPVVITAETHAHLYCAFGQPDEDPR